MPLFKDLRNQMEGKTKLESAARGAAQGITMGYADEMAGALGAGKDVITGKSSIKDVGQSYKKNRDESREEYAKAEADNPMTYKAGDAAGTVGSFFIPGLNAVKGVKGAAALGALAGVGRSAAEDAGGLAKDAAVGGALGAVGGSVAEKVAPKFANLAQKMGMKQAPLTAEEELRRQINPDLFALQKQGAVSPKLRSEANQLQAEINAGSAAKDQRLAEEAKSMGFETIEDYLASKHKSLMDLIRKNGGSSETTELMEATKRIAG